MLNNSQYMNTLYQDLFSSSPQTVSIEIPKEMGMGHISQTTTKQGVIFSDWQMNYNSDMNVHGKNYEEFIYLMFCMNEGVSWGIANEHQGISIKKGESCIYHGHGKTEYLCYKKEADFSFKSMKIPVAYFKGIMNDYFGNIETDAYEKKLFTEMSKIAITPYMEHIFSELKDFEQYRGGLGYLFLESKVMELLAVYLSEVLELSILASDQFPISRTDKDSILEAKRIIDSQLAYAPSLDELAKKINFSTSKLTRCFSAMFGKSIHAYIIEQRLEKAAGLLLQSEMSVTQIASMVGYSKASNFSAAFKKKYGVVPREYKSQKQLSH